MEKPATISAHHGHVTSVAFAPHRQTLVSGGMANEVKLWAVPAWELLQMLQGGPNSVDTLFFTSGRTLLGVRSRRHHGESVACKGVLWSWLHEAPFVCAQPRRWKASSVARGGVAQ